MDETLINKEWMNFRHETMVRTQTLLYVLSGIRAYYQVLAKAIVHAHGPDGLDSKKAREAVIPFEGLDIRTRPILEGEPLIDRMSPGGLAEQMAFKSWVSEIYNLWESRYRTNLKTLTAVPGAIRLRHQVLGDLRQIRHNLVHSESNLATDDGAGSCKILKWFSTGEIMQLSFNHVLDFLNQMDWLVDRPQVVSTSPIAKLNYWQLNDQIVPAHGDPQPRLVSVRPFVGEDDDPPLFRYGVSVAFSDGVFGRIAMGYLFHEASAKNDRLWDGLTVGNDGYSLILPGTEICRPSASLYKTCLSETNKVEGPGPWSRPVQFKE